MAAVRPAGPEPTITTSRTSSPLISSPSLSLAPHERSGEQADSPEGHPRHPGVVARSGQLVERRHQGPKGENHDYDECGKDEERPEQPIDDNASSAMGRIHRAL